jgi:hypothetical protein
MLIYISSSPVIQEQYGNANAATSRAQADKHGVSALNSVERFCLLSAAHPLGTLPCQIL